MVCDKSKVFNEFLVYWIKHNKELFKERAAVATFKEISKSNFKTIQIFLPKLDEQRKIARILQAVDRKIEAEENRKRALQALFKTLLHYLMTGKIRVKGLPEVKHES